MKLLLEIAAWETFGFINLWIIGLSIRRMINEIYYMREDMAERRTNRIGFPRQPTSDDERDAFVNELKEVTT